MEKITFVHLLRSNKRIEIFPVIFAIYHSVMNDPCAIVCLEAEGCKKIAQDTCLLKEVAKAREKKQR